MALRIVRALWCAPDGRAHEAGENGVFDMGSPDRESADKPLEKAHGTQRTQRTADGARLLCRNGERRSFHAGRLACETLFGEGGFEAGEFEGGLAGGGAGDALAQEFPVIGKNAASLAAPGNGDVKLLAADSAEGAGGSQQEDLINSLALRGVGSDGVAVRELAIVGRKNSAIGKRDGAGGVFDTLYFHNLPIHQTRFAAAGLKQEPVTGSDPEFAPLAHIKGASDTSCLASSAFSASYLSCARGPVRNRRSVGAAELKAGTFDAEHFRRLVAGERAAWPVENHHLSGLVFVKAALLCIRPGEGIEDTARLFIVADDALFPERLAHAGGDGIDLRPSRRDDQCGAGGTGIAAALDRIKVSGSNALAKSGGLLDHFTHRVEPVECLRRLLFSGQRDGLQIIGPLLAPDRGELAEGIAGMLLQNPQGIAA